MIIHNLQQGSDAWHAFRATMFGASEAAAMLGTSKRMKRTELLRMKKTATPKQYSAWVEEVLFPRGHAAEAAIRPILEKNLGDLYPVVASIEGTRISASIDGMRAEGDRLIEVKLWNEETAEVMRAGKVPEEHMPQCQQELMVTEADAVILVLTDGTPEKLLTVAVFPVPEWFERLRAGWAQFEVDLEAFVDEPAKAIPIGESISSLPALFVTAHGEVITSNLDRFAEHAESFLATIKTELVTDQDFADAINVVKFCGEVEAQLANSKAHVLSQIETVQAVFARIDLLDAKFSAKRIQVNKLVDSEKAARKLSIQKAAIAKVQVHVLSVEERLGGHGWLDTDTAVVTIVEAMKNKKSIDSLVDAANTAAANAIIAIDQKAARYERNWKALTAKGDDKAALFMDFKISGLMDPEAFDGTLDQRIKRHAEASKPAPVAIAPAPQPAPPPIALARRASDDDKKTYTMGQLNEDLGFQLTMKFVTEVLKVKPAIGAKGAANFSSAQRIQAGDALVKHINEKFNLGLF